MPDFTFPAQRPIARPRSFAAARAIGALMLREIGSSYGRSPGGYAWAIVEPVAGIAVLTYASAMMFSHPPIGRSFELFYATGMLPFLMFTMIANRVGTALLFSRPLLVYPAVTFADAILARFFVTLLTELLVFVLVIAGLVAIYDTGSDIHPAVIAQSLGLTAFFALAVGTANAYLFLRWHLWHVLWAVISRPLFVISGVFFLFGAVPDPIRGYLWYNPIIHVIGLLRAGFYPTYSAAYASSLYVLFVSLVLFGAGMAALSRHAKWLLHEG
jgi:capsular polysaccharide transport system permease protein